MPASCGLTWWPQGVCSPADGDWASPMPGSCPACLVWGGQSVKNRYARTFLVVGTVSRVRETVEGERGYFREWLPAHLLEERAGWREGAGGCWGERSRSVHSSRGQLRNCSLSLSAPCARLPFGSC